MLFPQIRLESSFAQTELTINKPVQEMKQPKTDLEIKQPKAELTIERTPSRLTIDQTQAWEDMDLKHILRRIEEAAQLGYQAWLDYLGSVSEDGDELMRIEHGGGAIVRQAKRNSERPPKQFNIGWIPSHFSVKIAYEPSEVEIRIKENKPIIDVQTNKPIHDYTTGSVEVNIAKYQSLSIDFENLRYVGIGYDKKYKVVNI